MTHDLITEIPRLSVTIYKHVIPTYYTLVTPVECAYMYSSRTHLTLHEYQC